MADQYKKVTKTGYGSRIMSSIKGIFVGILLFIASFVVLYWNEGRVDVSEIAEGAVEISATEVTGTEPDGELVSVTGIISSQEQIGDGMYLKPGEYLSVTRIVEIYAWVERTESESETNWGGSETTETTYNYIKEWVSTPTSTGSFEYPEGHENPTKTIEDLTKTVSTAKVGVYDLNMDSLALAGFEKLSLSEDILDISKLDKPESPATTTTETTTVADTTASETGTFSTFDMEEEAVGAGDFVVTGEEEVVPETVAVDGTVKETLIGNYIYIGKGSLTTPEVGDMRISYSVLKNNTESTILGKLDGMKITTYVDPDTDEKLYRMFTGTKEEAVSQLHGEYKFMLWLFRAIGFLMMWMGLSALFGPISVLLDIVPFFGSLSRTIVGAITFIASLVLSIVTIVVSMILHNVVALIIAIVVTAAVIMYIIRLKGKKGPKPGAVKV